MTLLENRQVRLVARPQGIPQAEHFSLVTEPVARVGNGEILIQNRYVSVDPVQRGWANDEGNYSTPVPLNTPMRALALGEVVESHAAQFRAGEFVYGWFGWQRYCIAAPDAVLRRVVPSALPLSANMSVLGMNGLTAYLAFTAWAIPSLASMFSSQRRQAAWEALSVNSRRSRVAALSDSPAPPIRRPEPRPATAITR